MDALKPPIIYPAVRSNQGDVARCGLSTCMVLLVACSG